MTTQIAIVTGEDAPDLTSDGQRLRKTLQNRGYTATPVEWTDATIDWTQFDAALLRSCWKYYLQPERFRYWLSSFETSDTVLLNPASVVRWNLHKSYLLELEEAGIPIIPTTVVDNPSDRDLAALLRSRGWNEAVVKPAIGTSSAGAWRTSADVTQAEQARFESRFSATRRSGDATAVAGGDDESLLSERGAIVQRFMPDVADGERALAFFQGEYSHAWMGLRAPPEFGLTATFDESDHYTPSKSTIDRATETLHRALEIVDIDAAELPYARVDCINTDDGFRLMELELIEPYLNLGRSDTAVETFAWAIEANLEKGVNGPG